MTSDPFSGAAWISRAVRGSQRIIRETRRDGIEWAAPGQELAQTFHTDGPVRAVGVDLAGPQHADDPYALDVRFTLTLETLDATPVAKLLVEGPQLLWDRFGHLIDVSAGAPPGDYLVVLRVDRGTIGWYTANAHAPEPDDGVSPIPVVGQALTGGRPAAGTRLLAVDTDPAPNPIFRGTVDVDGTLADATLTAAVLGCGVIRINGRLIGEETLEPAVTDYDKTVLYRTRPIAHLLHAGSNEITIEAGRERYAARGGDIWGWNVAPWHREPTAIAKIALRYTSGHVAASTTGPSWQTAAGPVESEIFFRGEAWAVGHRLAWAPVAVVQPPSGTLRAATHPPMRSGAPKPPVQVEMLDPQRSVYDFGEVMTGRIRCVVTGSPGARLRVLSGEQRAKDGAVICVNLLVAGEAQVDTLRLDDEVRDFTWEPQFGYRGFRWVQVETSGDLRVAHVQAVPITTPTERVGDFAASEPLTEWVNTALARCFMNNLHGIPTDTPIYEKNGWTADAHLATEALLHHFDLRGSFGKWLDDHVDAQGADGSIPQIIPTPGWGRASDPAWSASAVLIPWYLYWEYGELTTLERYAPMIRRFADNLIARSPDGIWRHRSWGDWLAPGHHIGPEGMAPIGTLMSVQVLRQTAAVLRELEDSSAETYADAAGDRANAYHHSYYDAEAGHYAVPGVGYRQVLNVLPLAFSAVPTENLLTVRASLINDIEIRTQGHLDCGAIGVRHLLPVLTDAGRDDLAVTVLTQPTRPGWGAWFNAGETTLLESWDGDARSRNHYFLGSVASWIQQRIGGLRATAPGWTTFDVSPINDPRIVSASIRHRTPHGDANAAWERGPGGWSVQVTVPPGTLATVDIGGVRTELGPGNHDTAA